MKGGLHRMPGHVVLLLLATATACVYGDCNVPPVFSHMTRFYQGLKHGDVVNYTCVAGYRMSSSVPFLLTSQRKCEVTDAWDGSDPSCIAVTCSHPGSAAHTTNSPTTGPIAYLSDVTYECVDGYRASDGAKTVRLTCQADTTWNKPTPTCSRVQCPAPENVPFASRTQSPSFYYGDAVQYTCLEGYERTSGNSELNCDAMRNWNGTWPLCEKKKCGDPGTVVHSARVLTGIKYQHSVVYTCFDGYSRNVTGGSLNRTCQADGTWSGTEPQCLGILCGVPSNEPADAQKVPAEPTYRYPENIKYTCNEGFRPDMTAGLDDITCQKSGKWDFAVMVCTRVHCPETNRSVNAIEASGTFYFGQTKTYECNVGNSLASGNLARYCQANGTFTGSVPVCEKLKCPPIAPTLANANRSGAGEMYRDVVTYQCKPGFQIKGEVNMYKRILICQVDATWSADVPVCESLSCGTPSRGSHTILVQNTDASFNSQIKVRCEIGYELTDGQLTRTCLENTTWSGTAPICSPVKCPVPPGMSNVVRVGNTFQYPARVYYQCAEGYKKLGGGDFYACEADGKWGGVGSGMPTCEKVQCYQPEVIRGADMLNASTQTFFYGDVIEYRCQYGYVFGAAGGPLVRTCGANKLWSGERPICDRRSCGDPGDEEGTYKLGFSFRYMDTVNYTCKAGYEVASGKAWSVKNCLADGNWTGETPRCNRVFCGDPGISNHSTRVVHGLYYGDKIEYTCFEGYRVPNGIYKIECIEDRSWTYPTPECVSVEGQNLTASINKTAPAPVDSESGLMIGRICIIVMSIEFGVIVLLDLTTIWKDIRIMIKNIKYGVKQMKQRLDHKEDRVSPTPLTPN